MLDKINHFSMNNPASVYDEEALTALELAARTAAKVNECVEEVNQIDEKVQQETLDHIEKGTFREQFDKYTADVTKKVDDANEYNHALVTESMVENRVLVNNATGTMVNTTTNLTERVDNLLSNVPDGSTTMDAEIIDARVGNTDTTYPNIGAAMRNEIGYAGGMFAKTTRNLVLDVDQTNKTISLKREKEGDYSIIYADRRYLLYTATDELPVFDYTGLGDGTYDIIVNMTTKTIRLLYQAGKTYPTHFYKPNDIILAVVHMSANAITKWVYAPFYVTQNGVNPYNNYYTVSDVMGVSEDFMLNINTTDKSIVQSKGFVIFNNNNFVGVSTVKNGSYSSIYTSGMSTTVRVYYNHKDEICVNGLQCINPTDRVICMIWFDKGNIKKILGHPEIIDHIYVDGKKYANNDILSSAIGSSLCNIFQKVVCVGDSFTSGHMTDKRGVVHETNEQYAWPHFMSKLTKSDYHNCGCSGCNVLTWQTHARGLAKARSIGKAQAYIIGLMINDAGSSNRKVTLGSIADIGTDNQTYYGGMSKIIRELIAISPNAKIFVCTCPQEFTAYNQAVKDIVNYYKDMYAVHCLDLNLYKELFAVRSITDDLYQWHYTAAGYEQFAEVISLILSNYIKTHISDFQDVAFIEYT